MKFIIHAEVEESKGGKGTWNPLRMVISEGNQDEKVFEKLREETKSLMKRKLGIEN